MNRFKLILLSCVFAAMLTAPSLTAQMAKAAPLNCGTWKIISSWNIEPRDNVLYGVAADSSDSVWAVGYATPPGGFPQTLIQQWNGMTWSIVSSPNLSARANVLNGIADISSNDVWAVGYYNNNNETVQNTLIEHWDGTAWSVIASPNPGKKVNALTSIAVVSANDIWAVGNYSDSVVGSNKTLVEHWDGTSWSAIASPNISGDDNYLNGVTAASTNDVWAVGIAATAISQTLVEHWDGTSWSIIKSPNVGKNSNVLSGVAAVSTSDVWAVGNDGDPTFGVTKTLIQQWNGRGWNVIKSPNVGKKSNSLSSIAVVSPSDIWAVGFFHDAKTNFNQTLIEQWNGTSWGVVPSPDVIGYGAADNSLNAVTAVPTTSQAWTVGSFVDSFGSFKTLTEFYC